MSNEHGYVIKELQERLKEMKSMTPLPEPASPEAMAMGHEAWMKQNDTIVQYESEAMIVASFALPPDVRELLKEIQKQKYMLLGIDEEK